MKTKNLLLLGATLSLTACSVSELGLGDGSPDWRPYKDIDQSTQYISFISTETAYEQSHPNEARVDSVGRAYRKSAKDQEDLIGNLYYIYDDDLLTPNLRQINPCVLILMAKMG